MQPFQLKPDKDLAAAVTPQRGVRSMWDRLTGSLNAQHAASTADQYLKTIREFCTFLGLSESPELVASQLASVTDSDVVDYINWCKRQPAQRGRSSLIADRVSPVTIKKKLNSLASCYRHLIRLGICDRNPFLESRDAYQHHKGGDRRRTEMLDFTLVRQILDKPAYTPTQRRDKAIIAALVGAGLRRSEACGLRLMDVAKKQNHTYLTLRNTKAQRSANQLILPWAAPYLLEYCDLRRSEGGKAGDAVFIAYTGREASGKALSGTALYLIFKRYLRDHGVDDTIYTPHSCRATVITLLLERGKQHRTVQKFSRHSSIEMVVHYDKLRDADRPEEFDDVEL